MRYPEFDSIEEIIEYLATEDFEDLSEVSQALFVICHTLKAIVPDLADEDEEC